MFAQLQAAKSLLIHQKKLENFGEINEYFYGRKCLEIGGPSSIFQPNSFLPLYPILKSIDNVNFSNTTVWKKGLIASVLQKNWVQKQFVLDATNLAGIKEESYDCVLSSHVLEHIANPLRALFEWRRILKVGGILLLILPHKSATFDRNREVTKCNHLLQDYENGVDEHDLSHLAEILNLHDLSIDPEAKSSENFAMRSKNNFDNRCLHHHVFVTESAICIMNQAELKVLTIMTHLPFHIIIVGKKLTATTNNQKEELHHHNLEFLRKDTSWRKQSCFELDKTILSKDFCAITEF